MYRKAIGTVTSILIGELIVAQYGKLLYHWSVISPRIFN